MLLAFLSNTQTRNATISLQLSFPQQEYKNSYPITATGLLFGFAQPLKKESAISVGGEFGVLQVNGKQDYYTGFYNNVYNTYHVASWNHIITLGSLFRADLFKDKKKFNIFIDVSLGANMFITSATISREVDGGVFRDDNRVIYYYKDFNTSIAFRAGAGLGLEFPFGKKKRIAILMKGSYLYGSYAKYYARPTINNTEILLDPRASKTSMILSETGIRFSMFNKKDKSK